jgi:uncharacterized protein
MSDHNHLNSPHLNLPLDNFSQQPGQFCPISAARRIDALDMLRGFALIGVLLMNIEWFSRPFNELGQFDISLTGWDHVLGWLIRCLVEGKFYKLFSLLFGMGFAVMLTRANAAGRPFDLWFSRRMVALFVMGVVHSVFFWVGDILHTYAISGMLLLAWLHLLQKPDFQRFADPGVTLKIALGWMFLPLLLTLIFGIGFGGAMDHPSMMASWQHTQQVNARVDELRAKDLQGSGTSQEASPESVKRPLEANQPQISDQVSEQVDPIEEQATEVFTGQQEERADSAKEIAALHKGSYWQATAYRAQASLYGVMISLPMSLMRFLPIFMLGYWLIISGVMTEYRKHQALFRALAWGGTPAGLFMTVGALLILQHPATARIDVIATSAEGLFFAGQYFMAAGYLGIFMVLLCTAKWPQRLGVLAPLGKMALTNYIMHSVILSSVFYGYGGGYYGEISRSSQVALAVLIIAMQILLSRWWLNHFYFGPLEWLWRSFTYSKWQRFTRLPEA